MLVHLRSTLTALLLSAGVALGTLGASTTQARADADEAVRIIGGLIALYAIGRAIENSNRHQPSRNAHVPTRPRHLVAPARCFVEGYDRNGPFRGYVQRCMVNTVSHAHLLPPHCLRDVHTQRGLRTIYGGRCLAQNGWVREAGVRH